MPKRESIVLWHKRLVHVNKIDLKIMHKHSKDVPMIRGKLKVCHPCRLGKAKKKSFASQFEPATYAGEIVHSDLAGPIPKSHHGLKYLITFMDQFSRFTHAVGTENKSDASDVYRAYNEASFVKKYFPNGFMRVHSDGGGEYKKVESQDSTETTPETPEHNPFAERLNRTILEPIRVVLEEAGLSRKYWDFALEHVIYVNNGLYHSGIGCTPYEKLTAEKPTLKHIRVFGCAAFVFNHEPKTKVHSRASPGIFPGCDDNGVYSIELLASRKLIRSVHVTFDEETFPALEQSSDESSSSDEEDTLYEKESCSSGSELFPIDQSSSEEEKEMMEDCIKENNKRYPKRTHKEPDRFGFEKVQSANIITIPITTTDEPSMDEAMSATPSEVQLWLKAIEKELSDLKNMGTWKPIGPLWKLKSLNKKALPTHIILKIKRNEYGLPMKFKARLVAGGNLQVMGRDVDNVYAPVVDYSIILLILAISHQLGWMKSHVYVTSAFLNGEIDREVYVSHPYNFPKPLESNQV